MPEHSEGEYIDNGRIVRPIPDPTRLTTEQLHRELNSQRELFDARLDATDAKIDGLAHLHQEKMQGIKDALEATKQAVNVASIAADRAIQKSETGFTNDIDSLKDLMRADNKALVEQINNLTRRLDRGEGTTQGQTTAHDNTMNYVTLVVAIGALVAVVVFGILDRPPTAPILSAPFATVPLVPKVGN